MRLVAVLAALVPLLTPIAGIADEKPAATLYKTPGCGCCEGHADHLRAGGFAVTVIPSHDLPLLRRQHGVPAQFEGCHMIMVDGYVVEGHVPAAVIMKLLTEKPGIKGISLPGMPEGSPGMSGPKREPFTIYEIGEGAPKVFAVD
jgi:hypothetical protein